jgi:ketosteroid isomerase-like protein
MHRSITFLAVLLATVAGASVASGALRASTPLPPLQKQPTAAAVVKEHLAALNACDWNRLMAQYPANVHFFLPAGQVVKGRVAVGKLFEGFCKSRADGGLNGIKFTSQVVQKVGDTINVQWVATAPFMKPYKGADAYVTRGGYMVAQVTTFGAPPVQFKK